MGKTSVVNIKSGISRTAEGVVYIGRPSKWGNPFVVGVHGSRFECIERYRQWLQNQSHLLEQLHELRGRRLACFCKPFPCHGDVLAEMADGLAE